MSIKIGGLLRSSKRDNTSTSADTRLWVNFRPWHLGDEKVSKAIVLKSPALSKGADQWFVNRTSWPIPPEPLRSLANDDGYEAGRLVV
jgi:hypothetical protein